MKRKNILVTGGAGYIGSFTVRALEKAGWRPVVFDNLEYGHRQAIGSAEIIEGNLVTDQKKLLTILQDKKICGVIHFAAYTQAGESMEKPEIYFRNNVLGSLNLLDAMRQVGVKHIVFSSTCAVYGQPKKLPITENEKKEPESPYGESKLMVEKQLAWFKQIHKVNYVALRYFNAAGAELDGSLGEEHTPETHLIPLACQTALGKRPAMTIFGNDYPTPDGTCVRDYIHVLDLAQVHLIALKRLFAGENSGYFNVGTGRGYSVKQVIEMVKKVSDVDFQVQKGNRRPGDPAFLFADNRKICREFKWKPKYSDLKTVVASAWKWHQLHPDGYQD